MSIKIQSASYVAELTESASGSLSITVTPLEQSGDYCVPLAIETYSVICETILKLWRGQLRIYADPLRYRC